MNDQQELCKHADKDGSSYTAWFHSDPCPWCIAERLLETERRFEDMQNYAGLAWGEHMRSDAPESEKMSPREEIERYRTMLRAARCPNRDCDNKGTISTIDRYGELEPAPCQWCFERDELLKAPSAGHVSSNEVP